MKYKLPHVRLAPPTTHSDGVTDIVNCCVSNCVDGVLKVLNAPKCLFIAEEGEYNPHTIRQ